MVPRTRRIVTLYVHCLSCPVLTSPVQSCPHLSCLVLSCPDLSCPVLSSPVLSCHVLPCPVSTYSNAQSPKPHLRTFNRPSHVQKTA